MTDVRRRRLRVSLLVYLVLLLISTIVRRSVSHSAPVAGMRVLPVRAIALGRPASSEIELAFVDTAPGSHSIPVILVHGSPGSSRIFRSLTAALSTSFRMIVPDLPGFGASSRNLPDYSFRAHARYLLELLDALRLPKAQFVGFSMGGGVVLSLADLAPQRVASIAMISAIGVQEQELLGSYSANHFLHGALLAGLWLFREALPHFGQLDGFDLNVEFARNFYDSDQRPLRSILQNYRGPMLIIHGTRDTHVPAAAAIEHHRLVPQSELKMIDGDHFMVFQRPGLIVVPLEDFLRRAEGAAMGGIDDY